MGFSFLVCRFKMPPERPGSPEYSDTINAYSQRSSPALPEVLIRIFGDLIGLGSTNHEGILDGKS
jgi:hypothetical protein